MTQGLTAELPPTRVARARAAVIGERWTTSVTAWVVLAVVFVLVAYPIALLIGMAFNAGDPLDVPPKQLGLGVIEQIPEHLNWLGNSLLVAVPSTVLTVAIGVVLAWIIHRIAVPGRRLFELLILIPYPMGPLVAGFAWSILGAPSGGLFNTIWHHAFATSNDAINVYSVPWLVIISSIIEAPVAVLIIGGAMQRADASLEECAVVLGSGPMRTAWKVTLPLLAPALVSSAVFVFATSMGEFALPSILGTPERFYTTTTAIYTMFATYPPNYPLAAALGAVLIIITGFVAWLGARYIRRHQFATLGGKAFRQRLLDVGRWRYALSAFAWVYAALALALPLLTLILSSLQKSSDVNLVSGWTLANFKYILFSYPTTHVAIVDSLIAGIASGFIASVLALIIAWYSHRTKGAVSQLLQQVTMVPQSMPRLIFSVGLLWMLLSIPLPIYGTIAALIVGYTIVFLPLAFQGINAVVGAIDPQLEEAARMSGAHRFKVALTVTVPLLLPGLIAAWALVFMTSIREVNTGIFLSSSGSEVLGPTIFSFWNSGSLGQSSALVVVQSILIGATLVASQLLSRRATELS